MKEAEVLELEQSVESEYRKKMEAIRIVRAMIQESKTPGSLIPVRMNGHKKKEIPSPSQQKIEGKTFEQRVLWLIKNIEGEFGAVSLFALAEKLDPKRGKLKMEDISNTLWRLKKSGKNAGIFEEVGRGPRNVPIYRYTGQK